MLSRMITRIFAVFPFCLLNCYLRRSGVEVEYPLSLNSWGIIKSAKTGQGMSRQDGMTMSDRISDLPDEILSHILSFLPTKLVVATCVLSKRWKTLWLSIPTLDFEYENIVKYSGFVDLVNKIMILRDVTQPIKKFSLKCSLVSPPDLNKWLRTAMKAKVEHLELSLRPRIKLPSRVLRTRNLVVLKLSSLTVKVKALSSVDLPSLKILHLNLVCFSKHGYLVKLLSGCPILEDLQLKYLIAGTKHNIETEFKRLPKLSEFLHFNDIPTFCNLTQLELILFIDVDWLMEVLSHCPKLRILVINKIDNSVYNDDWSNPQFVPECLSSHLQACSTGPECARYIMKNARVLQTITIVCSTNYTTREEELEMIKVLCKCPRSSAECELSIK